MSAKSHSFGDPLPTFAIYADSSFILNLITHIRNTRERFKTDCESFLKKIQLNMESGLCLVTSDFGIDEVLFKIIENELSFHLKETSFSKPMELFKNRPEIIQSFLPKIQKFYDFLDSTPFIVLSYPELKDLPEELNLQVKNLVASYNLLPGDAYHIAIGKSAGIKDFVAVDADWFRVDEINLFTCLPNQ